MDLYSRKPALTFALSMAAAALLPLLCGWVFYVNSSAVVQRQQQALVAQSLHLTMEAMDRDIIDVTNRAIGLRSDLRRLSLPERGEMTTGERLDIFSASRTMQEALAGAGAFAEGMYLIRPDGDYAVTQHGVLEEELLYRRYYQPFGVSLADMRALHSRLETGTLVNPGNRPAFVLSLNRDRAGARPERQLVVLLSEHHFVSLLNRYGLEDVSYALCSLAGEPLITRAAAARETGEEILCPSGAGNYRLAACVPHSRLAGNSSMLRALYLCLLGVTVLLAALMIFLLARRAVMPINEIISHIRRHSREGDTPEGIEGLNLIRSTVEQMLDEYDRHSRQIAAFREQEEMRNLADAFLGLNPEGMGQGRPYVAACFPLEQGEDARAVRRALLGVPLPGWAQSCVPLSDALFLLLEKNEGDMDENGAAAALEGLLSALDDAGQAGRSCAMSLVHRNPREIETAYREASMAADYLYSHGSYPVLRFDAMRYSPEYFLRDYHHLDKQLAFARRLGEDDVEGADGLLPGLFPGEFLENPQSGLAQLHLSALKYQFIHDVGAALERTSGDADELTRLSAREILSCKTHAELKALLHRQLEEIGGRTQKADGREPVRIDEVKAYIRRHSMDPQLSVASVAAAFELPSNTLSKLFSRRADMGVLQYIHKIRIENACSLLLGDSPMGIEEIAAAVGYASVLTFSRAFKARYHMPPGEYRRLHRENS